MSFSFGSTFNLHEQAMYLQARRTELLSSNLANAETPHYKAKDFDFKASLQAAVSNPLGNKPLRETSVKHIQPTQSDYRFETLFRMPYQTSLDGNTVESQVEMSAFNDNAIRYMASLRFLNGKISTLMAAIRGD
ncbi:Flagellar basal-body rod protein FlgB [hydrothermal vent metagenome]|uniref:Flagellar basal-body rod protein FlgB n=1 Tax=hydrothermal vent metagenome TaxID=652676 RepID=A0A3B1AX75_9ZZZZ